jgi:hypothetical protein
MQLYLMQITFRVLTPTVHHQNHPWRIEDVSIILMGPKNSKVPANLEVQIAKAIYALTLIIRRYLDGFVAAYRRLRARKWLRSLQTRKKILLYDGYKRWISSYWSDVAGAGVAPSCCTRYTSAVSDRSDQPQMASALSEPTS